LVQPTPGQAPASQPTPPADVPKIDPPALATKPSSR
jgi:hypothetical protein